MAFALSWFLEASTVGMFGAMGKYQPLGSKTGLQHKNMDGKLEGLELS
jgi:hypothetical protein